MCHTGRQTLASPVALCAEQVPRTGPVALTAASSHIYTLHLHSLMHRSAENKKAALFSLIQLRDSTTEYKHTHTPVPKQACLSSEGQDCPDGSTIRLWSVCRARLLATASLSACFNQARESCRVSRSRFMKNTTRRESSFRRHLFRCLI